MWMTVHYFLYSDFRFTFPLKFKFIDFALHLLLKKEKKTSSHATFCLALSLLQIKWSISYKKASRHVKPVSLVLCWREVRNTAYTILSFSQLVSGCNSTNPAIWLVPGAGGIFSSGPPQQAESVELIYFCERISGNCQSFDLFTLPSTINQCKFISIHL